MSFTCGRCRLEKKKKACTSIEQVRKHYAASHTKAAKVKSSD